MSINKILLIDDNQSLLEAYQTILSNEGFQVDIAESGERALEILKSQGHQIVITDIKFPNNQMDGFKIIEEAKHCNSGCEIIVMSGYSDFDMAIKAMHLDASDFLPKPCRKEDLLLAIRRASKKLEMRGLVKEYTEKLKGIVEKRDLEVPNVEEKLIHTARLAALGEMSASICHELRQPLCGMLSFAYLLADHIQENAKAKEYLKKIEEQINQMECILNNMRFFSRKGEGNFTLLPINEIIHSAASIYSHQFKNNNIELKTELGNDMPPISGDRTKIQQVIINLLSNARDAVIAAHNKSNKRIIIKTVYNQRDKKIEISITDNGTGIDRTLYDKIFQSFFSTKAENQGTGLGLSVSKSIISHHNGEIRMRSKKGSGSTFTISLPVQGINIPIPCHSENMDSLTDTASL